MNDEKKLIELQKDIDELLPELKQKKAEYDKASKAYYEIENKRNTFQREIDIIKKKMQVETFKKTIGKGELLSFREFFKEIQDGRDFSGKTAVWSFKNGKSGMFLNLWVNDIKIHEHMIEKYHYRYILDPEILIKLVQDFSSTPIDGFCFDAFTVGSMVDGHAYRTSKGLDDVYVFICDTKTIADFTDITITKGLFFYTPGTLPYLEESLGELSPRDEGFVSCRGGSIPQNGDKYVLYPLKATGASYIWRN